MQWVQLTCSVARVAAWRGSALGRPEVRGMRWLTGAPGAQDPTGEAASEAQKHLTLYELDLGLNHVVRKWSQAVDNGANMLVPVPGGADGPGGLLVCAENFIIYKNQVPPVKAWVLVNPKLLVCAENFIIYKNQVPPVKPWVLVNPKLLVCAENFIIYKNQVPPVKPWLLVKPKLRSCTCGAHAAPAGLLRPHCTTQLGKEQTVAPSQTQGSEKCRDMLNATGSPRSYDRLWRGLQTRYESGPDTENGSGLRRRDLPKYGGHGAPAALPVDPGELACVVGTDCCAARAGPPGCEGGHPAAVGAAGGPGRAHRGARNPQAEGALLFPCPGSRPRRSSPRGKSCALGGTRKQDCHTLTLRYERRPVDCALFRESNKGQAR